MVRTKNVLLVDDDEMIREILATALNASDVAIYEAGSCNEAVAYLNRIRFDVVILDNQLPDGNGITMIWDIVKKCPHVIMITGDGYHVQYRALSLGAEAVFSKPFDPWALAKYIRKGWNQSDKPSLFETY